MKICIEAPSASNNTFLDQVERESGEDLSRCYQCGNCSGSCPVSDEMDIAVSQVIRLVTLGQEKTVLESNSMWVCVSCFQCQNNCPKCLDPSKLMESLRRLSLRKGHAPVEFSRISNDFIEKSPQQAIVAGFRKLVP